MRAGSCGRNLRSSSTCCEIRAKCPVHYREPALHGYCFRFPETVPSLDEQFPFPLQRCAGEFRFGLARKWQLCREFAKGDLGRKQRYSYFTSWGRVKTVLRKCGRLSVRSETRACAANTRGAGISGVQDRRL